MFRPCVVAMPMFDSSHTSRAQVEFVQTALCAINPRWRGKIKGITADGAASSFGCHLGADHLCPEYMRNRSPPVPNRVRTRVRKSSDQFANALSQYRNSTPGYLIVYSYYYTVLVCPAIYQLKFSPTMNFRKRFLVTRGSSATRSS